VEQIAATAVADIKAGKGHDLVMFPWPPAQYQRHAIDHTGVYRTVAFKYGNIDRFGHRSTFDPKSKRYFAFCDSWMPAPLHFLQDCWAVVNMPLGPVHYNSLRSGGKRIRAKLGIPCGLALAPSLESNVTLHSLLYGFSSLVQDASGNVAIRNARTVEALAYVKALYEEAGSSEQLTWGPSGNVRAMLARKSSATTNAISLLRAAEKQHPEVAKQIMLQPPLLASGGVIAMPHVTNCSVVWNFADNKDGAQQFLADLIDNSGTIYEKSKGCNFPIYQKTVANLVGRVSNDPHADPAWKYQALRDALHWTVNFGYPGYATPVAAEVFNQSVIPRMFMSVVRRELSPADAANAAGAEIARIAEKWQRA
jgi:multiple sugar transport system substrate-binding protein